MEGAMQLLLVTEDLEDDEARAEDRQEGGELGRNRKSSGSVKSIVART